MAGGGENADGDIGFQIAPMIDLILVLLIYFMATVAVKQVENVLGFKLPGKADPSSLPSVIHEVKIEISGDGRVRVGELDMGGPEDSQLESLRVFLRGQLRDFENKCPVTIMPNGDVKHKRVVDVLNACVNARIKDITFGDGG